MTDKQLQHEIDLFIKHMRTCDFQQRDYAIGALTALLWVQMDGKETLSACHIRAIEIWNRQREGRL